MEPTRKIPEEDLKYFQGFLPGIPVNSWEYAIQEFLEWSIPTFSKATKESSLDKAMDEIYEIKRELMWPTGTSNLLFEYVDALMCIFDSAKRAGISTEQLLYFFQQKTRKNKSDEWHLNNNNTYSRIKINQ